MVKKLNPQINKVYFINQYTLVHILSGTGTIEVDFKNYPDWADKAIYLSKGQYVKFLSDDFQVRLIEFPDEILFKSKDVRVLFKHLISLGYINFSECSDCKRYLDQSVFSDSLAGLIDVSSEQWFWQNPFQASKSEYQLIFDIKDIVDTQFANHLTNEDLAMLVHENGFEAQALVKDKIGITVKELIGSKRLLESKREIAFTDMNIQEIAYDMGYKDPSYFNRVFKRSTGVSPAQFRKDFEFAERNSFVQDILELVRNYHTEQRSLEFYAEKMNLSVKAISHKTRQQLNTSLGQLIRHELLQTAKSLLVQDYSIIDIAFRLGFEEPNHFSQFFKHYSGLSPSDYKLQKYHS